MVMAILIHDRETFLAAHLRPSLSHIHNLRIEIPGITGKFLINIIGQLMRNFPQYLWVGLAATRRHLTPGNHIPQHKFNL